MTLPSQAGREARSGGGVPSYVRHRSEHTLLRHLVEEYFPAFMAHLAAQGAPLPKYVELEFEEFLKCRRLEHGLLLPRCDSCSTEHLAWAARLVQLQASRLLSRTSSPSCSARRMAKSATLLVDDVLGRLLGIRVSEKTWSRASTFFDGTAPLSNIAAPLSNNGQCGSSGRLFTGRSSEADPPFAMLFLPLLMMYRLRRR